MKREKKRRCSRKILAKASFAAAMLVGLNIGTVNVVLAVDGACLNNNGDFVVPVGDTYNDGITTWMCDPTAPAATSGGWVAAPSAPTPAATAAPPPTLPPAAVSTPAEGDERPSGRRLFIGGVASAVVILATVTLVVWRARRSESLRGDVRVGGGQRINLARYGRHASLGRQGKITVGGDGVVDRHAAMFSRDGADWIEPLDGPVRIGRSGASLPVRQETQLSDGDRIDFGGTTLIYNNLAAARTPDARKRGAPWLR